MGLGLHYKGRIKDASVLPALIEEVKDIIQIHDWKFRIFEQNFSGPLDDVNEYQNKVFGISFTPPKCETVSLCFLSNGRLSGPLQLKFFGKYDSTQEDEFLYSVSVKTQFAGPNIHIIVVDLIRYLSQRYFSEFEMSDEGQYWDTADKKVLLQNFDKYNNMLSDYKASLENFPMKENENLESYMNRLVEFIQKKGEK